MNKFIDFRALFLAITLGLTTGCSNESGDIEAKLCSVYAQVNEQTMQSRSLREGELAQSIQSALPEFFDEHYTNLVQVDWSDRPEMLGRLLGMLNKDSEPVELCDPIRRYYDR